MVAKNPFTKEQGAYLAYIQRWKATGEGLPHPCCPAHRGEEPTTRIRFKDFGDPLRKLAEVEFYLIALKNDGKTRGGSYPKLVKEARGLRALLLIEEEKAEEKEKEEEEGAKADDADTTSTATLAEQAASFEETVKKGREIRERLDEQRTQKKPDDDGTVTV